MVFKRQKNTLRDRKWSKQMKKHTTTNQKTVDNGIWNWLWGGGGQRRLIATLGYDCGSGGSGRQQRWLAMAGSSRGWLWLVAAPGEDNECNGGRGGGLWESQLILFNFSPAYNTLSSLPIVRLEKSLYGFIVTVEHAA